MAEAEGLRNGFGALVRVDRSQRVELSHAQQRMWFLWQLDPQSPAYNVGGMVRLSGALDAAANRTGAGIGTAVGNKIGAAAGSAVAARRACARKPLLVSVVRPETSSSPMARVSMRMLPRG